MHTREIGKNLFQIDLETGGFKNLICSYVIKAAKITLVESGPTSSVPNLVSGLKELDIPFENVEYLAITHVHLDHGGGAGTLLKLLPNAKVLVHSRGMPHLINPEPPLVIGSNSSRICQRNFRRTRASSRRTHNSGYGGHI